MKNERVLEKSDCGNTDYGEEMRQSMFSWIVGNRFEDLSIQNLMFEVMNKCFVH